MKVTGSILGMINIFKNFFLCLYITVHYKIVHVITLDILSHNKQNYTNPINPWVGGLLLIVNVMCYYVAYIMSVYCFVMYRFVQG